MSSLALVSTIQPVINYNGDVIGNLIVEVVPVGDDIAVNSDFYWTPCADGTVAYFSYVDLDGVTVLFPSPVYYSTTNNNLFPPAPRPYSLGQRIVPVEGYPLSNYTDTTPPVPQQGQTLYFYSGAWVVSSFDPSLTLPAAKTSLISTVTQNGATAVNNELGLYSNVQQIEAGNVLTLDALSYPGTTIGEYQTYVDGLVASSTATINAASSTTALYSFNPADVPFTPAAYGTISGSRTGNDFNNSYYVTFYSDTLINDDTELFIPATSTVIPYILPNQFNGFSEAFTTGNYLVQIRQSSTGFVLAEYICPAGPPDVVVSF